MRTADRIDLAIDLTAAVTHGAAFGIDHMDGYSLTFAGTGTFAGTLIVEASNNAFNDNVGVSTNENANATWVTLTGSSNTVSSAGVTVAMYNTSAAYYRAFRWTYTKTSSTGSPTATVWIHAKGPQS